MHTKRCRICNTNNLVEYLSLGSHPPSDGFLTPGQFGQEAFYPLAVLFCPNCFLSQLSYVVSCTELYCGEYPYETRMNTQGVKHFRRMADKLSMRFLNPSDLVVDIGSNDGTLLEGFKAQGMKVCGVEPVSTIAEKARVSTINDFFGELPARSIGKSKAQMVTATNVFAHVDDIHELVKWVEYILTDDGTFIIEAPYFPDLVDHMEFDTIYHEHLSYLSVKPLDYLFNMYGLEIFDVEHFDIHGGSLRYYITRKGYLGQRVEVKDLIVHEEKDYGIDRLRQFAAEVEAFKYDFFNILYGLKLQGKTIVGVSAPAKGNTLINYCEIGDLVSWITEKSTKKIGRYTPGAHIEVVSDDTLLDQNPDYAIIFAWNWQSQIKGALKGYKGQWIIPTQEGIKDFQAQNKEQLEVA